MSIICTDLDLTVHLAFLLVRDVVVVQVETWQTISVTTLMFPTEVLVDYVRVYQRKGSTNVNYVTDLQ
jgi:hypothetical protein